MLSLAVLVVRIYVMRCGASPQVLNRDLSITVIKAYDELRRSEATPKSVRREHAAKLAEQGLPAPTVFPTDLQVRVFPHQFGVGENVDDARCLWTSQPRGLRVLEALGATGLRSIRYCKEIPVRPLARCNDPRVASLDLPVLRACLMWL